VSKRTSKVYSPNKTPKTGKQENLADALQTKRLDHHI